MKKIIILTYLLFTNHTFASDDIWSSSYALEAKGLYARAAAEIAPLAENSPDSEMATLRLGWLYYLQGYYNESIRNYKRAISLNNNSIEAKLGIINPLQAQYRWKEAMSYADAILEVTAWHYDAYVKKLISLQGLKM